MIFLAIFILFIMTDKMKIEDDMAGGFMLLGVVELICELGILYGVFSK